MVVSFLGCCSHLLVVVLFNVFLWMSSVFCGRFEFVVFTLDLIYVTGMIGCSFTWYYISLLSFHVSLWSFCISETAVVWLWNKKCLQSQTSYRGPVCLFSSPSLLTSQRTVRLPHKEKTQQSLRPCTGSLTGSGSLSAKLCGQCGVFVAIHMASQENPSAGSQETAMTCWDRGNSAITGDARATSERSCSQ